MHCFLTLSCSIFCLRLLIVMLDEHTLCCRALISLLCAHTHTHTQDTSEPRRLLESHAKQQTTNHETMHICTHTCCWVLLVSSVMCFFSEALSSRDCISSLKYTLNIKTPIGAYAFTNANYKCIWYIYTQLLPKVFDPLLCVTFKIDQTTKLAYKCVLCYITKHWIE